MCGHRKTAPVAHRDKTGRSASRNDCSACRNASAGLLLRIGSPRPSPRSPPLCARLRGRREEKSEVADQADEQARGRFGDTLEVGSAWWLAAHRRLDQAGAQAAGGHGLRNRAPAPIGPGASGKRAGQGMGGSSSHLEGLLQGSLGLLILGILPFTCSRVPSWRQRRVLPQGAFDSLRSRGDTGHAGLRPRRVDARHDATRIALIDNRRRVD